MQSTSRVHVIRLRPHEDLKKSLVAWAVQHNIKAAVIVTCVGSLEQYTLRFANQQNGISRTGHFEIVSLTGTLSNESAHLHLAVSDSTGQTTGGHLLDNNLIYTTAEIAIAELPDLEFDRETDSTYGYKELAVRRRSKKP
ncbi:MAG TPA: PPC domain-containing DNA-binding protein [Ohtaekwangia sp.]